MVKSGYKGSTCVLSRLIKDTPEKWRGHLSKKDTLQGPKLTKIIHFSLWKRGHLSNEDIFFGPSDVLFKEVPK